GNTRHARSDRTTSQTHDSATGHVHRGHQHDDDPQHPAGRNWEGGMMPTLELEGLRRLVRDVLETPHDRIWTLQGFGMLRTYLGDDMNMRLHVWDARHAAPNVSSIHNHPWGFTSLILSGEMENVLYQTRVPQDFNLRPY